MTQALIQAIAKGIHEAGWMVVHAGGSKDGSWSKVAAIVEAHIQRRIAKAVRAEREAIMDEWWMCVQADLEHGVKALNERAAEKWRKEYPAIVGFDATIRARSKK